MRKAALAAAGGSSHSRSFESDARSSQD